MKYRPIRDDRFEYIWDVMSFVEEQQCNSCTFKSDRPDYPMCFEVEHKLLTKDEVEELDDRGEHGVVCTKYVDEVLAEEAHPDQQRLF